MTFLTYWIDEAGNMWAGIDIQTNSWASARYQAEKGGVEIDGVLATD